MVELIFEFEATFLIPVFLREDEDVEREMQKTSLIKRHAALPVVSSGRGRGHLWPWVTCVGPFPSGSLTSIAWPCLPRPCRMLPLHEDCGTSSARSPLPASFSTSARAKKSRVFTGTWDITATWVDKRQVRGGNSWIQTAAWDWGKEGNGPIVKLWVKGFKNFFPKFSKLHFTLNRCLTYDECLHWLSQKIPLWNLCWERLKVTIVKSP